MGSGALTGQTIGHYLVLDELGRGGMGVVYKARDTRLGRLAALKVLRPESQAAADATRRFLREAQTACALNHPNILTIYEIGSEADLDYIAMELVEGGTLADLVASGPLPAERALRLAAQVADALAVAHAASIVHRDLKPSNIMMPAADRVKVVDFGLAKVTGAVESTSETATPLTSVGAIVGTAPYMSPEQASGLAVDARSDLFSLGTILYEMLAGRMPFRGDSAVGTLAAILKDTPAPIPGIGPTVAQARRPLPAQGSRRQVPVGRRTQGGDRGLPRPAARRGLAVHRRAAVREHERREGGRLPLRGAGRGDHRRPHANPGAACHRPHVGVRGRPHGARRSRGGIATRCRHDPRGQRTPRGLPRTRDGAARVHLRRLSRLERALRSRADRRAGARGRDCAGHRGPVAGRTGGRRAGHSRQLSPTPRHTPPISKGGTTLRGARRTRWPRRWPATSGRHRSTPDSRWPTTRLRSCTGIWASSATCRRATLSRSAPSTPCAPSSWMTSWRKRTPCSACCARNSTTTGPRSIASFGGRGS